MNHDLKRIQYISHLAFNLPADSTFDFFQGGPILANRDVHRPTLPATTKREFVQSGCSIFLLFSFTYQTLIRPCTRYSQDLQDLCFSSIRSSYAWRRLCMLRLWCRRSLERCITDYFAMFCGRCLWIPQVLLDRCVSPTQSKVSFVAPRFYVPWSLHAFRFWVWNWCIQTVVVVALQRNEHHVVFVTGTPDHEIDNKTLIPLLVYVFWRRWWIPRAGCVPTNMICSSTCHIRIHDADLHLIIQGPSIVFDYPLLL